MKIEVKFEIEVDDSVTHDQVEEWVEFELGYTGSMKTSNPLTNSDIEADNIFIDFS